MKFTFSWLKTHLETTATPQEIADKLTAIGLEVDQFTDLGKKYAPFVVAEIKEAVKHPNADKLRVCTVNNGKEDLQIVCGAPNARAGIKVVLAPVGAMIPNGGFQIKKSKIRDVESNGMLCSADELELDGDSKGIIEVPADAEIGSGYADYAGLNDSFYEINVTPNRADALSVYGIARDLAAAGMGKLKSETRSQKSEFKSPISVDSETYYIGRYFAGVENVESPAWLKQRLTSIGLTPISALVDITNFITFDLGQPLHVFDADKLQGNLAVGCQLLAVNFEALDKKTYQLGRGETVIADDSGPVALAGVIGGAASSVTEATTNIFLEAAYFDPDKTAKTGRHHQIITDARYRFERGVDVENVMKAAEFASALIVELCGGTASEFVIAGEKPKAIGAIKFAFDKIKTLGGLDIEKTEAEKILTDLGFQIKKSEARAEPAMSPQSGVPSERQQARTGNIKIINPPSWRADVTSQADIVEEILRIKGYDKVLPQVLPFKSRVPVATQLQVAENVRNALVSRGLTEAVTYSFTNPEISKHFNTYRPELHLQNPISSELSVMRQSIVPNLLMNGLNNINRGFKNLGLFEIGPVFGDVEQKVVCGLRMGKNNERNVYGDHRNVDVFEVKGDVLAALGSINAPAGKITREAPAYYHPGRSGGIYLGKNCVAVFGEIHPRILKQLDISQAVSAFEIFLKNTPLSKPKYQQLVVSQFQSVKRDFAFVVDGNLSAGDLVSSIIKTDKLISNVFIFDIYQGDKVEAGKKSVALSVEIQPQDKTLNDAEIEAICTKINSSISLLYGATLRA